MSNGPAITLDFLQLVGQGTFAPVITSGSQTGINSALVGANPRLISSESLLIAPTMPTAAVTVEVLSSNAGDTAAGAGARSVRVIGLDDAFNPIQTETTLNGVTPVSLGPQFRRVLDVSVIAAGTYGGSNLGLITARIAGGGAIFLKIPIGFGKTRSSHLCVPAGFSWYAYNIRLTIESNRDNTVRFWSRGSADIITPPVQSLILLNWVRGRNIVHNFSYQSVPLRLSEKTDVWVDGQLDSNGESLVYVSYDYIIVRN